MTLSILFFYFSVESAVGCNIVSLQVILFHFVLFFVLFSVLVLVITLYVLLSRLLLLLLLLPQGPRESESRRMSGRGVGVIVGEGFSWGRFRGKGFRWGVRGWENGSRGCALAKFNHVQGSQAKSIRKAIWAIPCQSTEKKGQRQKVEFFWWNM